MKTPNPDHIAYLQSIVDKAPPFSALQEAIIRVEFAREIR